MSMSEMNFFVSMMLRIYAFFEADGRENAPVGCASAAKFRFSRLPADSLRRQQAPLLAPRRFTFCAKLLYNARMKQALLLICLLASFAIPLPAQSHTSVSLDSPIYHILELAEMRGLISPLSGVRPYTRSVVIGAIHELLATGNAGRLRASERQILEDYLARLQRPEPGLDLRRGGFFAETALADRDFPLTFNLNVGMDFELSSSFIPAFGESNVGAEFWVHFDISGDIGRNVSYGLFNQGGLVRMPRRFLGLYNTYYEGFENREGSEFQNRVIRVYSDSLVHFPFTYRRRWDGSLMFLDDLTNFRYWPDAVAGGYSLQAELTSSFFDNALIMRLGRMPREWGSMPLGTSLTFNRMARPFLAMEMEFNPFPWLSFSSLTGILEYHNTEGIKTSAQSFQNAFSINMLQLRFRNFVFFDLMDGVVWPKRFELGYMAPIVSNFFYQNFIGDFDNLALSANLRLQYPGIGNVWASIFVDEMRVQRDMWSYDRTMIAYQFGANIPLRFLSFSSLRFSYTKINPYTFTHNRNFNPWYSGYRIDGTRLAMETAWINNGASLGHYLPPNSDQFLLQFRTMPTRNLSTIFQYQLIRRGANFGSSAVDGSHLLSELDPDRGHGNPVTFRHFLRDGAYQWMHIIRASANWRLPNLPVSLFGEAGVVFSYFTNIVDDEGNTAPANVTGRSHSFRRINTPEYPVSTTIIARIGFSVFR